MRKTSGTQAYILGIASAGYRLSLILNVAACQILNSGIEIHSIAKGISLFALILKQMGQTIQIADHELPDATLRKTCEIAGQGQRVFDEIEHMLDILKNTDTNESLGVLSLYQRVTWCFRKHYITYLLAHLEYLKLSLIVMLKVVHLGMLMNTVSTSQPDFDDRVAEEKVEIQNMIVVRYWSSKRLGRLWELVEQEDLEARNDQTIQQINYDYLSHISRTQAGISSAGKLISVTKHPLISLGEGDAELDTMKQSPRDMVKTSEKAVKRFLSTLFPSPDHSTSNTRYQRINRPRSHTSSESEHDSRKDQDYGMGGNHLEPERPFSQDENKPTSNLRRKHSKYQAHVGSDSEDEHTMHSRRMTNHGTSVENNDDQSRPSEMFQWEPDSTMNNNTTHFNSTRDADHNSSTPPQPNSHIPHRQCPTSNYSTRQEHDRDRYYQPSSREPPKPPKSSPRSSPKVHFDDSHLQRPESQSTTRLSSSAPSRSPYDHFDDSISHNKTRDDKDRHKSFARSATKGLVGVSAIAGFLDALEAFVI